MDNQSQSLKGSWNKKKCQTYFIEKTSKFFHKSRNTFLTLEIGGEDIKVTLKARLEMNLMFWNKMSMIYEMSFKMLNFVNYLLEKCKEPWAPSGPNKWQKKFGDFLFGKMKNRTEFCPSKMQQSKKGYKYRHSESTQTIIKALPGVDFSKTK